MVTAHQELISYKEMRSTLRHRLQPLLTALHTKADQTATTETWEWAGPAVLDAMAGNGALAWLKSLNWFASLNSEEA